MWASLFMGVKNRTVEVGTTLTGRPPHRSGLAELPHPALAVGHNVPFVATYSSCCICYLLVPALCPGRSPQNELPPASCLPSISSAAFRPCSEISSVLCNCPTS